MEGIIKATQVFASIHVQFAVNCNVTDVKDDRGSVITVLDSNGRRLITLGDLLYVKDHGWYQCNRMDRLRVSDGHAIYRVITAERSDTSLLLLPMYGGDRESFRFSDLLVNAYCFREGFSPGRIWLLYRIPHSDEDVLTDTLDSISKNPWYLTHESFGTEHIVVTMSIPDGHIDTVHRFFSGKFSKFTQEYKESIYRFHNINDRYNRLRLELERHPVLKQRMETDLSITLGDEDELRSAIVEDRETLKVSMLIDEQRTGIEKHRRGTMVQGTLRSHDVKGIR
jgi:hypothetical protein